MFRGRGMVLKLAALLLAALLFTVETSARRSEAAIAPPTASAPAEPLQAETEGARVYVAGRRSDTGAPVFAWTENIYVASPTWQSNTLGLPSVIGGEELSNAQYFRLDPWSPSTTGYFVAGNSADGNSIEVYKNTNMRGGGAWTKIFDRNTLASLKGTSIPKIEEMDLLVSPVIQNFIGMVAEEGQGFGPFNQWFVHSHDAGSTWSGVIVADVFAAGNAVILGNHNADIVYVNANPAGGGAHGIWRSLDHGHTFAQREQIDLIDLVMPENSNLNDDILFSVSRNSGHIARSTNGADTWTNLTGANGWSRLAILHANLTGPAIRSWWR